QTLPGDPRGEERVKPRNTRKDTEKDRRKGKGGIVGLLFEQESYAVLGACFEVYKEMGCGFLEAVYQECLELELERRGVPFRPQPDLFLNYKGRQLQQFYKSDLVCYEKIAVEIKAVKSLEEVHRAQLHNYLKGTGLRVGYLVNFGHYPKLEYERIVR